ncbi:hypothetical protein EIN_439140 [Entamoeba invadens IP1]|uniref:Uncharacterized protein n=1 Tax=Entamoeba invadens IP1 TaxID=370355 RepID=A0A0A1TX10_ENTIV|nr:hypothetical protein EIN_439140 [Entamoeba invadens IP1]ELP83880.1 hypothetical protein EIN_439140 [Entamoeba invadens IP1]|eukprot:XP_004183226.1 hypothetical protein EIN_439140 [Entamoeba invadens IP1]
MKLCVVFLISLTTFVNAKGPLDNPLIKKVLGLVGVNIISPSDIVSASKSCTGVGGIANFAMQPPLAQPGSEGSIIPLELQTKAIEEVQRQMVLALDLCFYGPYGIPFYTPLIQPCLIALNSYIPFQTIYDNIENIRKQAENAEYGAISGMGPKGFIVARNLNLRHRVDLGTWKDTNPA